MARSLFQIGKCRVLGHRGAPLSVHENTLDAFQAAMLGGADGVELDVRRSGLGTLVIHHDADVTIVAGGELLPENTDGGDVTIVVSETPDDELPSWIPTLDVVLAQFAALAVEPARPRRPFDRPLMNIEIKNSPPDPDFDPHRTVATAVVDLLVRRAGSPYPIIGGPAWDEAFEIVISSFDLATIDRVRSLIDGAAGDSPLQAVETAFLVLDLAQPVMLDGPGDATADPIQIAAERGHTCVNPWWPAVTEEHVRSAADAGVAIVPWTCDEPDAQDRLRDWGVAGVITNDPIGLVRRWG